MYRRFLAVCLFCVTTLGFAQESPEVFVRQMTDEVLEIVRNDKEIQNGNARRVIDLVGGKVLPHFNFERMTSLAVGKDWRKATPEQKQKLVAEFRTLLVRTYANALTGYKNQKIVYKPVKMVAGDVEAMVRTEVIQPGSKPVPVDYFLEKQDAAWKFFDVNVAGISLVTNYREQFAQEVRQGGIDGLIDSMINKNKTLEAKLSKNEKP